MSFRLEARIEEKYVKMATAIGCMCIKLNVMGHKARPDRLVVLPVGGTIFIEFKALGKELYALQAYHQRELHKRKQIVETFDNEHNAILFTQAVMGAASISGGGGTSYADPSLYGPAYGSRPRQDIYDAYGVEAPEELRYQQEAAGDSTPQGLLLCLAQRGGKVEQLLRPDLDYYPWEGEGGPPVRRC